MGTLQNKADAAATDGIFSEEFSHLKWVEFFPSKYLSYFNTNAMGARMVNIYDDIVNIKSKANNKLLGILVL